MQQGGSLQSFTALFNMEGNAEAKLLRISQNMNALRRASMLAGEELREVRDALRFEIFPGKGASKEERLEAGNISSRLTKLAESGKVTSTSIQGLSNRLSMLAKASGVETSAPLAQLSEDLLNVGSNLRLVEQETSGANSAFSFMGDVSLEAAQKMRMVSAAAQGAMLSMSLLQKNITGVAFSLIFLQFSGALKLSLAFAGVAFAGGVAYKQIVKLLDLKKDARELATSFFVVTGSLEAQAVAAQKADEVARRLGLTGGREKDLTKALTIAQLELRERGIEPTSKALNVFTNLFAVARAGGNTFEDSLKAATEGMLEFQEKGSVTLKGVVFGFEELQKRGVRAIAILRVDVEGLIDDFPPGVKQINQLALAISGLFEDAGITAGVAAGFVEDSTLRMGSAFGTLEQDILDVIDEAKELGVEIPKELQLVEGILSREEGSIGAGTQYGRNLKNSILDVTSKTGTEVQKHLEQLELDIKSREKEMAILGGTYARAFTDQFEDEFDKFGKRLDLLVNRTFGFYTFSKEEEDLFGKFGPKSGGGGVGGGGSFFELGEQYDKLGEKIFELGEAYDAAGKKISVFPHGTSIPPKFNDPFEPSPGPINPRDRTADLGDLSIIGEDDGVARRGDGEGVLALEEEYLAQSINRRGIGGGVTMNVVVTGNKISSEDDAKELANIFTKDVLRHIPGAGGAIGISFQ